MQDYKIIEGDIVIEGADFATIESTRQRLRQKLLLWRGEWFTDRQAGFPYLQQVLGQAPRPEVVSSLIRQLVINDEGVQDIRSVSLEQDAAARRLRVAFTAVLVDGTEEQIEVAL